MNADIADVRRLQKLYFIGVNPQNPCVSAFYSSLGIDSLEVFVRDDDLTAETGVRADVLELGRLFGAFVEQGFELRLTARIELRAFGPNGRRFYDECFAIRIKLVGHAWSIQKVGPR